MTTITSEDVRLLEWAAEHLCNRKHSRSSVRIAQIAGALREQLKKEMEAETAAGQQKPGVTHHEEHFSVLPFIGLERARVGGTDSERIGWLENRVASLEAKLVLVEPLLEDPKATEALQQLEHRLAEKILEAQSLFLETLGYLNLNCPLSTRGLEVVDRAYECAKGMDKWLTT